MRSKPFSSGACPALCSRRTFPSRLRAQLPVAVALVVLWAVFHGACVVGAEESAGARRQRIEGMTPAERARLSEAQKQFVGMERAEQEHIRKLHEEIHRDPQADELLSVMRAYHEWLMALPAHRRADLLALDPEKRIERIKTLRVQQSQEQTERLVPEDANAFCRWLQAYAAKREKAFLKSLPEASRQRLVQLDPPVRRWGIAMGLFARTSGVRKTEQPTVDDLVELQSALSPAGLRRLELKPLSEQWRAVFGWIRQEIRTGRLMPPEVAEDLDEFCLKELSSEQQDRLIGLPQAEMQQWVWRLYCMERFGPEVVPLRGSGHSPRHRPPGRSGPRRDNGNPSKRRP